MSANSPNVIVTTSKSYTRRAPSTWKRLFEKRFEIQAAPAREDPFDPAAWWRDP